MSHKIIIKNILIRIVCLPLFSIATDSYAGIAINGGDIDNTIYTDNNTHDLLGTTSGTVSSVSWQCESGCNQGGTASGTTVWSTGSFFLDPGRNIVTATAHNADGSTDAQTINIYYTIPDTLNVTFPYSLDFDGGASSLDSRYIASSGASATYQASGLCYSGGCARFIPAEIDNSYAGLGGFSFPANTQQVNVRYLIYFGEDYVTNLDTRHKHILIHRQSDVSGDRGMAYIWHNDHGDFSPGACDNTDCRYEGGKIRPDGTETFIIGEHLREWISIEVEFNTATHLIQIFVTTQDGAFNNTLLVTRSFHSISADLDYWSRLSVLGAYIDRGTISSPGMYWIIDELVIDDNPIGPPAGFVTGETQGVHPNPPVDLSFQP